MCVYDVWHRCVFSIRLWTQTVGHSSRIRILRILAYFLNSRIFTNFKNESHEFSNSAIDINITVKQRTNGIVYILTMSAMGDLRRSCFSSCSCMRAIGRTCTRQPGASIPMGQGGHVPQYLDWGDMITNVPPYF